MKNKILPFFTVTILLTIFSAINYGQGSELIIEPYSISQQFIEKTVYGDTTATGERVDTNRVYVLRRGGEYYQSARIILDGFNLYMKAEEGTGARPTIQNTQSVTSGNYDSRMFIVRANHLNLQNLVISNWYEGFPETLPTMGGHIVDCAGAGNSVLIDNCVLEGAYSAQLRFNAASLGVRVTNTIFANAGNGQRSNLGNGRAIDFRTASIDSAFIQNCTFVNITDRVIRHYGGSQLPIRNFVFDHNTIVNVMAAHGCLGLGLAEGDFQVTNNLFVDPFMLGNDSISYNRLKEFADTGERSPSGAYRMTLIGTTPTDSSGLQTDYRINNNFYYTTPAVQDIWEQAGDFSPLAPLTWEINKKVTDSLTAFVELETPIAFTDAPATPLNFVEWYVDPDRGNRDKATANFTLVDDYDRKSLSYFATELDLSFNQDSPAYYSAERGFPAGNLNYFPELKEIWEAGGIVGVSDDASSLPSEFSLEQNYPNPFNPTTKIVYNVAKQSHIKLAVYDILGRQITSLVNEVQPAGRYTIDFNASQLSTGVYFYRLSNQNMTLSKKMILMK